MGHKTQDTLFLVGGALLGATALYLLDPKSGQRRRQRISSAAEDALEYAKHSAGSGWDQVSARAKDIASRAADETSDWQHSASESAHGLTARARKIAHMLAGQAQAGGSTLADLGGRIWNRARNWSGKVAHVPEVISQGASHARDEIVDEVHQLEDWLSKRANAAKRRTGEWLGYEDGIGAGTITSTAIGFCAVGAGVMYFMDPNRGRARRAWIADKTASCVRTTGHTMRSIGRSLANRCQGLWHDSRETAENMMGGARRIDSEILVQRIRAEMGHLSPNFNLIQIMADADGTVTLTGNIARYEVDGLLTLLHRMPGVTHVINRMNVSETGSSQRIPATMASHG